MITFINRNDKLREEKNTINITYPRTVSIIFGNFPYPEILHNFIMEIKSNLKPEMENATNVKGGMTDFRHFIDNINFNNFIAHIINKHQNHHPLFQNFFNKYRIINAWGNEIKPKDSLNYHNHEFIHGILYLTKGCDLMLPELNIKISPEPGDYYLFPPFVEHGFSEYRDGNNRYSLVFNVGEIKNG